MALHHPVNDPPLEDTNSGEAETREIIGSPQAEFDVDVFVSNSRERLRAAVALDSEHEGHFFFRLYATERPSVNTLANAFSTVIREWLTEKELNQVRDLNAVNDVGICSTGDYCDSNMAMMEAFQRLFGRDPDFLELGLDTSDDRDLWNDAWWLARNNEFRFVPDYLLTLTDLNADRDPTPVFGRRQIHLPKDSREQMLVWWDQHQDPHPKWPWRRTT